MNRKKQLFNNDIVAGLVFLGIASVLFFGTLNVKSSSSSGEIGSAFFPRFVAVILILSAILPLYTGIKRYRLGDIDNHEMKYPVDDRESLKGLNKLTENHPKALTILLIAVYSIIMEKVGFIISTTSYLFLQMIVLSQPKERNYILFAIISLAMPIFMYWIFATVFETFLPLGILSFIVS